MLYHLHAQPAENAADLREASPFVSRNLQKHSQIAHLSDFDAFEPCITIYRFSTS